MRKILLLIMFITGCTADIPPESIAPIAATCQKYGLRAQVSQYQIRCFKSGKQ